MARKRNRERLPRGGNGAIEGLGSAAARILSVWAALALPVAAAAYGAYAMAWPSSQLWGSSMHRLQRGAREIALTFDDGPSNETERFLAALDRLDVRATFFVCGRNVERRPRATRAIADAGHAIGNHTFSHPRLPLCSDARARSEVARTQEAIGAAVGARPSLFRAPYGLRSPALRRLLPEHGLAGVHWSVIGRDWKLDAPRIARRVLAGAGPGSIVCLHDGHETFPLADRAETLKAVRRVVPQLKDLGYRFVALAPGARGREA